MVDDNARPWRLKKGEGVQHLRHYKIISNVISLHVLFG